MGLILCYGIKYHQKIISRVNFVNILVNINNFLLTVKKINGEQEATVFLFVKDFCNIEGLSDEVE